MQSASVLQLLNELEKSLDNYLVEFKVSDKIDEKKVSEEWKDIKKQERQKNQKEKIELEKKLNKEKQERRQNEKDSKKFTKIGKPVMMRSDKPEVKRNI